MNKFLGSEKYKGMFEELGDVLYLRFGAPRQRGRQTVLFKKVTASLVEWYYSIQEIQGGSE